MEDNLLKRNRKSSEAIKFLKMYLLLSIVIFTAVIPTQSLYIPGKNEDTISSSNSVDSQSNLEGVIIIDDDDDDDDVDLEDALNDYYDSLIDNLELEVKAALEIRAKMKEEEERKKKQETKYFPDYDYMSDMPAPEAEIPDKKSKTEGQISLDDGNYTWGFYNGSNSTFEDLHVLQKLSRESQLDEGAVLRMRELRLNAIKNQILMLRGPIGEGNETVPDSKQFGTLREMYEKNLKKIKEWTSSNKYPERVRSFYASCDVPKNTDEDLWTNPNSMNLLFDLEFPKPSENTTINIVAAKLRLYKISQGNFSLPIPDPSASTSRTNKSLLGIQNFGFLPVEDDRQIRISVYWYTRSLRRNKVKRKLLDSQMFSVYGEEWTEFNIRAAVRSWRETKKNFGLFVTVEDEDGSILPADQYVNAMNCSKWTATVRPIPSILVDAAQRYMLEHPEQLDLNNSTRNETDDNGTASNPFHFQNLLYPILDLCTVEVPDSEDRNGFEFNAAKLTLDSQMINLSKRQFTLNNQTFNFTEFMKIENTEQRNMAKIERPTAARRTDVERNGNSPITPRNNYFQMVGLGSPSAGQNRNVLVPIIKKGEVDPTDIKMKQELSRMQNDSPIVQDKEAPKLRHSQRQRDASQRKTVNHSRLKNDYITIGSN